ncbi:extracellular solute-binding protein [Paenibacillus sp. NPDC093718]|uniref:extracellular solute-binding protein n=1 Tax=Paenibacillus sp. NPDC093718 TaxID=3390601 RepID=UPI003CFEA4B5
MLKRRMGLLLVIILILSIIAACTNGNTEGTVNTGGTVNTEGTVTPSGGNDPTAEPPAPENAEVTFSTIFSDEEFEANVGSYVKNKFPTYTINHISNRGLSLEQLVAAQTKFDIYFTRAGGFLNAYEPMKLTYDMTELAKKHGVDLASFAPGFIESATFDNQLYGLPIFNDSLVLFYNRDLFDKFGIPYPKDGMTWEETFALAHQFDRNENGTQYMGLWMSPKHYFRMNSLSQGFIDPETNKVTVDNDNWKRILNLFTELSRNPGVQNMAKANFPSHDHFRGAAGVSAMYVFLTEWIAVSQDQLPLNWDMVSMPVFKDLPDNGTQPYANYAGITSISENKDAAMQILKYLTSEEFQMEVSKKGKISPLKSQQVKDLAFENHPDQDKNFDAVYVNGNAPMRQLHPLEDHIVDLMNDKVTELVTGQKDVNTILREVQELGQQTVDQEMEKLK